MDQYITKENYITVLPEPDAWRNHSNYFIMNFYSKFIKGNVADLGMNHGACTMLLLDFVDQIESIHGYDMNYEALKVAFKTATELQPKININLIAANLLELPTENNKFDFIMSFHTLEHIYPEDSNRFAQETYRVLKPGGYFLISIPYDHAYPDPAHVAFYNVDSLCKLFEDNGFETIECMKDNRWQDQKKLLTALFTKS